MWDDRQRAVIEAATDARILIVAGPGEGKTAVACARIAHLVKEGVTPTRILLISFTRTAVAELRSRIGTYVGDQRAAAEVQLSTIDSHAWQLRHGFDDVPLPNVFGGGFDASIAAVTELLRTRDRGLMDYLDGFEHVLIDEAQDVVGPRADLIWSLTQCLPTACGISVFADPAQAIYGFAESDSAAAFEVPLCERLKTEAKPSFAERHLGTLYRVKNDAMRSLFVGCRELALASTPSAKHVEKVQGTIEEHASERLGNLTHEQIAEWCKSAPDDTLVLFRHRVDALSVSSYCVRHGIKHRLRISGSPTIVHPFIGALLSRVTRNSLDKVEWDELWSERCAPHEGITRGKDHEETWSLVHRFARRAGSAEAIELERLRAVLSRPRPPSEFCVPDWGWEGPVLGTIHASKGRESTRVALVVFADASNEDDDAKKKPKTVSVGERNRERERQLEEGRVMYVGATRGREALLVARGQGLPGWSLSSGRTCRYTRTRGLLQFEVGRDGDVERIEHLTWPDADENQARLAKLSNANVELTGQAKDTWKWRLRIFLREDQTPLGQLTPQVAEDRNALWKKGTMPADLQSFQLIGATTVALRENERSAVPEPFRTSGFALAPVVRGFAFQRFFARKGR